MGKVHELGGLSFDADQMLINIDGKDHIFALKDISPRLLKASQVERDTFEVSPSGYGIHWPMVDEDLSVDGLLGIKHQPLRSEMSTE